jgi:two-component system probable response regulator PhcQ
MYRIILVDDEVNVLSALKRALAAIPVAELDGERPSIETYSSVHEALNRINSMPVDLVISDYRMPDMSGVEFLSQAIVCQPNMARIILSGYTDLDAVVSAINKVQISRFINKPWHDFELKSAVIQALATRALILENQRLADTVRTQQSTLSRQERELKRLEVESPGITKLTRAADGGIVLDDADDAEEDAL